MATSTNQNLDFPYQVMNGVAGEFAELYSSYIEPPKEFFYIGFLTFMGCMFADRLTIATEVKPHPNLFVVFLGQSADDRKSAALNKTAELFREHLSICFGISSAEGLQRQLKENNRLILCFDEFKQFVDKCTIKNSVLLPCVNTLFESTYYESHTKHDSLVLTNAYLSLLCASTIDTYQRIWRPSFTDIGFNNRLFIVPGTGERKFSLPLLIPDKEKDIIGHKITDLIKFIGDGLMLKFTPEAKKLYHNWYMVVERSIHAKRLDTYALRFMALIAANEKKSEIDVTIVQKILLLMNWQLEVRKLYDPIDADNEMAKMEANIKRQLKSRNNGTGLTKEELKQYTNANRKGTFIYIKSTENLLTEREITYNNTRKKWELLV